MPTTTLIIDGDPVAYRAAVYAPSPAAATVSAVNQIRRWLADQIGGDRAIVCFSCRRAECFRRLALAPDYKAGRDDDDRADPNAAALRRRIAAARDGLREAFAAGGLPGFVRELPGLEADDVVGILATHGMVRGDRIIVADDKDLLTVPGTHSRPPGSQPEASPMCRDRLIVDVTEDDADRLHLHKTLTGEAGDGYPGCPGIGKAKADALFAGTATRNLWGVVVRAFRRAGLTEADALRQARIARVLRADDYDVAGQRVRLWVPPGHAMNPEVWTAEAVEAAAEECVPA